MKPIPERKFKRVVTALVVLLFPFQGYAVVETPQLPNPGKASMSRDKQIELGFQAASQVYQQMPVLPDSSPETEYIRKLGKRLVTVIPSEYSWPFQFHVIPQKEINAFALPGGPMFVNIGTITAASNEAELAGVMAHEMAHVYMQHSAKQAGKRQTTSTLAGIAGAIVGATTGGAVGSLAQAGIQLGTQGLVMKYSRSDEAQADAVGAIILYKSGYNPQAMADFFNKLAAQGSAGPQFFSDHPNPGNRQAAIQKQIAAWPPETYSSNDAVFKVARQQALGVKAYSAEEIAQGAKANQWAKLNHQNGAIFKPPAEAAISSASLVSPATAEGKAEPIGLQRVLPSSRFVTSDLGPMKIDHPDNWQVIAPEQKGQDLRIAPPAGITRDAVGYGLIMNGLKLKNGQSMSLDQVTAQLVHAMRSGGGDVTPVGDAQPIAVAGAQGRSVDMQSTSPFPDAKGRPQRERDWLVTVTRPKGVVLYFLFIAPQSEFERFRPSYEKMLSSLQFPP